MSIQLKNELRELRAMVEEHAKQLNVLSQQRRSVGGMVEPKSEKKPIKKKVETHKE